MPTEILDTAECIHLMATQTVGRLSVVVGRFPLVVPVNFVLDGDDVVFRTGPGAKLDAADGHDVAFQTDAIDVSSHSGWSVCLVGVARVLGDGERATLLTRSGALSIRPLESGDKPIWVQINTHAVTGRRIGPEGLQELQWGSDGYL